MEADLRMACKHHDQFIEAIARRDDAKVINLVFQHWELSRKNMELYVAPTELKNDAIARIARSRVKQLA
jgi:DNA-binding GntR family transcriptional regulator